MAAKPLEADLAAANSLAHQFRCGRAGLDLRLLFLVQLECERNRDDHHGHGDEREPQSTVGKLHANLTAWTRRAAS